MILRIKVVLLEMAQIKMTIQDYFRVLDGLEVVKQNTNTQHYLKNSNIFKLKGGSH